MTGTEIVKMSGKGQLVVPQDIRESESFMPGDRFIPVPVKEGVLFKKITIPELREKFLRLSKKFAITFKKNKVSAREINEAVKWARKK